MSCSIAGVVYRPLLRGVTVLITAAYLGAGLASAGIVVTGNVVPSAPTGDPWNVGGTLTIGQTSNATLTVDAGSDVLNTDGYVADQAGSSGAVTVSGAGSTWTSTGELRMGNFGSGTLDILSGGGVSVGGNGRIGNSIGGVGVATVDGVGSTLTTTNFLLVGREGNGTLRIQNQAVVSAITGGIAVFEGSSGAVMIQGTGSKWINTSELQVADGGTALLSIAGGGLATSMQGYIGIAADGIGTATISGVGSAWNVGSQLQVGYGGSGTLNVDTAGSVSSATAYVGVLTDGFGTVSVNDAGTVWNNSAELHIGYSGNGELDVQNGGVVSSGDAFIGTNPGGDGTATIDGLGSTWTNTGTLTVGSGGVGTLIVSDRALVITGSLKGTGGVELDGGVLRLTATDSINNILTLGEAGGTIDVTAGATATATGEIRGIGGLQKAGGGTLTVASASSYAGDTHVEAGTLNIGQSYLNDGADVYLKASAATGLNFAGTDVIDSLFIDGVAQPIGTYGAPGTAAGHPLAIFSGGGLLQVTRNGLLGDYNNNGIVDAADYTVWRNELGSGNYLPNDDTPGVAFDDYVRWKGRYGQVAGAGSGAAVPEPGAGILSLLAVLLLNLRPTRSGRSR